ncbi:MAG: EamA family transporter RarD [Chakrabartia sp.]
MSKAETPSTNGLPFALGAYLIWGTMPLYIKLLAGLSAFEVLAHRILWSVPVALAFVLVFGEWRSYRATLTQPKAMATMLISSALISLNWTVYMWAILHQRVLETSLGYYLNPLVNVLLGRIVLGERLNRWQAAAVAVAATGVGILLFEEPGAIWISATLALSFGTYGLVRKMAPVSAVSGLAVEVTLLAPIAALALFLGLGSAQGFGSSTPTSLLLMGSGIMTAVPLILFATAARRMSYTALGFVQYLAPTIVFFLSVFLWKEPLYPEKLLCFACIWTAIAIFSVDAVKRARAAR